MLYSAEKIFNSYYNPLAPTYTELHLARTVASTIMQQCSANLAITAGDAAIISERITDILAERAFNMSPVTLMLIHKKIFADILRDAGQLRSEAAQEVEKSLRACFETERASSYRGLTRYEVGQRLDAFAKELLKLTPFSAGNKYAVLVFMEKYKQFKGIK